MCAVSVCGVLMMLLVLHCPHLEQQDVSALEVAVLGASMLGDLMF